MNELYPYRAIAFDEKEKISNVDEILFKGCGTCVATCPSSTVTAQGFSNRQIFAEIEGLLYTNFKF